MKQLSLWGIVGIVSGILSAIAGFPAADGLLSSPEAEGIYYFLPALSWVSAYAAITFPGIIFGIVTSIIIAFSPRSFPKHVVPKIGVWIIASSLAYMAAMHFTALIGASTSNLYAAFFFGGFLGGSIITIALRLLFFKFRPLDIILLALLAGVLGWSALSGKELSFDSQFRSVGFEPRVLYIVWQTGMSLALGYTAYRAQLREITGGIPQNMGGTIQ